MTTANRRRTAPQQIAIHKADIANLIEQLQEVVAAFPADGNWPVAGSLGHIQEELMDLVRGYEIKPPVLDQDAMTIWFQTERARDKAKRDAARAPTNSAITITSLLGNESDDNEYGLQYGLQIQPYEGLKGNDRDAALDDAIDLLMSTALGLKNCVIPGMPE